MRSLLFILLLSVPRLAKAQMDTVWVPWTRDFTFNDGIYLSFQDLRRNAPSIPLRAITNELGSPVMDLDDVEGPIFRTNANGTQERFQLDAVWGYCQSGVVHVRAGTGFTRVGLMGSLAHVLYQDVQRIMDPYMMYGSTTYTVETQAFPTAPSLRLPVLRPRLRKLRSAGQIHRFADRVLQHRKSLRHHRFSEYGRCRVPARQREAMEQRALLP
ncbi:MAG: hypothetical protein IPK99_07295 [Flavobacteriales bacterium]|nr:hypothetical protein [Flavobacteriales bacterium]